MQEKCKIGRKSLYYAIGVLLVIAIIAYVVYITGGTRTSFSHCMYIPIIIAAFIFPVQISILFPIAAGLALGPFMPQNVAAGTMQTTIGWGVRGLFFIIVSLTVSIMLAQIKKLNAVIQKRAYQNPGTGLPNINKLEIDFKSIVEPDVIENVTLICFEYLNFRDINSFLGNKVGRISMNHLIKDLISEFSLLDVYSVHLNMFVVVFPDADIRTCYEKGRGFLQKYNELKYIQGVPVNYELCCGVVNYPFHGSDFDNIMMKLRITLDQVKNSSKHIGVFDENLSKKKIERHNILMNFYESFKKDKLTLHYQPKINIQNNEVYGVEALLRWKEPEGQSISIAEMIKIVENSGSISELTRWATEKAVKQIKEWNEKGIFINVSVNISAKDLEDYTIVEHMNKILDLYGINPNYFEYEITERSLIENNGKHVDLLNEFKKKGITISIDDYGTGCNSIMNMLNLPLDYIKIDKYFVDNVTTINKSLIKDIIDMVHHLGKSVCAEGVETEEQLNSLIEMGCDYVQGYFFSKAVSPVEIERFIHDYSTGRDRG
ncbi:MAG: EAL domain-containing protein [Solirubrobacterales bacterium]